MGGTGDMTMFGVALAVVLVLVAAASARGRRRHGPLSGNLRVLVVALFVVAILLIATLVMRHAR